MRALPNDTYRVTILYREPSYERARGRRADPYSWSFEVEALSVDSARAEAMRRFDELARNSGVGWVRRIERVLTEVPGPDLAVA